jgi:hypothetical protein
MPVTVRRLGWVRNPQASAVKVANVGVGEAALEAGEQAGEGCR